MCDASPRAAGRSTNSDEHLDELEDGAGCTEIWEHLSERRNDDAE